VSFTVNRSMAGHLSLLLPALALLSLLLPVSGDGRHWASLYLGTQFALLLVGIILAVVSGKQDGKTARIALVDLRVQAALFLAIGVAVQSGLHRWPLLPLGFFLLFPFTGFARKRLLLWLPALVPSMAAAGRFAFGGEVELVPWACVFLLFCVLLGLKISRDQKAIQSSRSHLDRIKSDAKEMMKRVRLEDRGEELDRIRGEEAATAAALDEDDLLQKLLVLGCRVFGARTGILLVPEETGYYRMRAAVHRGVHIVEDLVPGDKGFIHIAADRENGVLCVSDARSAGPSLGLYSAQTKVGSFLVKIIYDEDWARDAGGESTHGKVRCVLYFDTEKVNELSLDGVTSKRLEEFGSLVYKAMRMTYLQHRMTIDMSVKDTIARYARSLTRSLKQEVIAEETLMAVMGALRRCEGAAVLLYDGEDKTLHVEAASGELMKGLKDVSIHRNEASQVGLLLRRFNEIESTGGANGVSQVEILISYEQAKKSPFFHKREKLGRIISFAAIPCYMGMNDGKSSLKAAIVAVSSKADAFEREEVDDLRTLAGMMAPALDNAIQHRKVDDLSRTDGLTGLLNHRTFQLIFDGKINSMGRYGQSMAVVMVDADKFKAVNDTYGHSVGDEVLVELSKRLKSLVRKNDAVARYGGEEFAVVLDSVDEENARIIVEKMRKAISSRPFATASGALPITASFGFSILRKDETTTKREFLDQADQALYHAKENGRNRVVSFSEVRDASANSSPHTLTEGVEVSGEVGS
jgi:diguanylate cyclase (GGDEF)-like protein